MRRAIFVALMCLGGAARADDPPSPAAPGAAPPVLLMPTQGLQAIRAYLGTRPYDEVRGLVAMLEDCTDAQVRARDGAVHDPGTCPVVTRALHPLNTDQKK
jgi:hypothetical protein